MTKAVLETGPRTRPGGPSHRFPLRRWRSRQACTHRLMARLDRPRRRQRACADRGSYRPRILTRTPGCSRVQAGGEAGIAARQLIRAGLLFRQGAPPDATYLFKHALVQDAAYGLLLREPRRHLHARIAETLESKFGEIAESKPEVLARHWAEAAYRKSRRVVGEGRATIGATIGSGRSRGTAQTRA